MTDNEIKKISREVVKELKADPLTMFSGPDLRPNDLIKMGYPREVAYHPRLIGRYSAGKCVFIRREAFLHARQTGQNLIAG
jgi:hypothetical protein